MPFEPPRLPADGALPILGARAGDIGEDVIVVGDPGRATVLAQRLDQVRQLAGSREYLVYQGWWQGMPITVASHGVGSAGAAIAFTELCRAGARRIVRVGTCGGMQPEVTAGDVVVATAAVRDDGVTERLVPQGFPAVADPDLTATLWSAARTATGGTARRGIVLTSDLFYPGPMLGSRLADWQTTGVVATEMELSALFVIATLHGVAAAGILAVDGNPLATEDTEMAGYRPRQQGVAEAVEASIGAALTALVG